MAISEITQQQKDEFYLGSGRFIAEFGGIEEAIEVIIQNGYQNDAYKYFLANLKNFELRALLAQTILLDKLDASKHERINDNFEMIFHLWMNRNIVAHHPVYPGQEFLDKKLVISELPEGVQNINNHRTLGTKEINELADSAVKRTKALNSLIPPDFYKDH